MNGWVCVQSGKVVINNSDKVAQLITLKAFPGLQIDPHVAVIVFGIIAGWWKFLKISQQNVLEWVSENCDILRRPIDGTEYLSWLFLNDMRLYCWTKCITISNAFLEIDRHLNLLLPHFLHFGITQKQVACTALTKFSWILSDLWKTPGPFFLKSEVEMQFLSESGPQPLSWVARLHNRRRPGNSQSAKL